jgi:putative hemolysin
MLGDVGDEFKAAEPVAEALADGRMRLPGGMAVDDAAALLNAEWDTEATTVAGLVLAALGDLPTPGNRVAFGDYEFEVERVADRAIESVVVRHLIPEAAEADE